MLTDVDALAPKIEYDKAASIAKAHKNGTTLKGKLLKKV